MLQLIAAGVQVAGQIASNWSQAQAEKRNADFYREQAAYARLAQQRAEALAEVEFTAGIGQQISSYAASGVDMSGSAAITVGASVKALADEIWAIRKKGDIEVKLASMRGDSAEQRAETLNSIGYNAIQGAGTLLSAYGKKSGSSKTSGDLTFGEPTYSSGGGSLPSASLLGNGLSSYNV